MHPFKDYSFSWWQLGLLKFSMIAAGVLITVYFPGWFLTDMAVILLWIIFVVPIIYLAIVGLKQIKE
ncbi:TPA: hypothetical protein DD449_04970 [Candidatus Berkelbacteria bacterium]|nr:hypothetical protein [Candidatus Berkelbacteria bacterium]